MKWTPFILGIVEDQYSLNVWIFLVFAVVGFLLCYYRYKLAWIVLPIIFIASAAFLFGFIASGEYNHVSLLAPKLITRIFGIVMFSFVATLFGAFLGKRRFKNRQAILP